MIETIHKNLIDAYLEGEIRAIMHGVNCQCRMGSGLAKEIKERIPQCFTDYVEFCSQNEVLLGKVCVSGNDPYIFNCFTQRFYGRDGRKYVSDHAIVDCLKTVKYHLERKNIKEIGIPYMFCCGLGGGDWEFVYKMIEIILKGVNVKIYKL